LKNVDYHYNNYQPIEDGALYPDEATREELVEESSAGLIDDK